MFSRIPIGAVIFSQAFQACMCFPCAAAAKPMAKPSSKDRKSPSQEAARGCCPRPKPASANSIVTMNAKSGCCAKKASCKEAIRGPCPRPAPATTGPGAKPGRCPKQASGNDGQSAGSVSPAKPVSGDCCRWCACGDEQPPERTLPDRNSTNLRHFISKDSVAAVRYTHTLVAQSWLSYGAFIPWPYSPVSNDRQAALCVWLK